MSSNTKTLVIAIGGTGTKMAKLLTDRWGARPPRDVSIVVIDAHTGKPEVNVPSMVFSDSEQIDFPAEWTRLSRDEHSGLDQWWPHRVIAQRLVGFHNGCGAIRANGRFFVLSHTDYIVNAIDEGIAKLSRARNLGIDGQYDDIQWEVYVLCSLGNGTGGGCFMDVAAVCKDMLLSRGFKNPLITGVFIPGSVTREGSRGSGLEAMENRVAASGFASLVELQYEFNRDSHSAFQPERPYSFIGWSGGRFREFRPGRGVASGDGAKQHGQPYDFAFVLDCVNRRSVLNNYSDLMEASAEAMVALIGGADADSRLLDVQLMCEGGRRFGSFGTIALEAPTALLTEYCAGKLSLAALGWGSNERQIDPLLDADLLIDSVPGSGARLDARDVTLESSVDFFFDKVLNVKEGGKDPERTNEVFARFDKADNDLRTAFAGIQGGRGLGSVEADKVVGRATSLRNHLHEQAEDLPARREAQLRELWERVPPRDRRSYSDLEHIDEAGTRWLLEQRVARFVERGAFGPLVVWLTELQKQIKESRDSILEVEVRDHLLSREQLNQAVNMKPLEEVIEELKSKANGMFSMFQRSAIAAKAASVGSQATNLFESLLWQSKIVAVLRFYDWVDSHIGLLLGGAVNAARLLGDEGVQRELQGDIRRIEQQLNSRSGGSKVVYVGCDEAVRKGLLETLEKDSETCSREMLHHLTPLMWKVFGQGLGTDRGQVERLVSILGIDEVKNLGRVGAESSKRELVVALPDLVEERIKISVADNADIDELLVREARAKITAWYTLYQKPSEDNLPLNQEAKDAKDALEDVVHDIEPLREHFRNYPDFERAMYRTKNGKVEGAVMEFIMARVRNLAGAALPLWNPVITMELRSLIQRKSFFNYNKHAIHLGQALAAMDGEGIVKAQAGEFFPPSRVECVSVALGATLANLARESEIQSYRLAMEGLPGAPKDEPYASWYGSFNPHISLEYEAAGQRWLERDDEQHKVGTVLGDREGELVLALAEFTTATHPDLFGYLVRRGAHYYVKRIIPRHVEGSDYTASTFGRNLALEKKIGPKGVACFTDWLEGKSRSGHDGDDGAALCRDLKELLWLDLDKLIRGYWDGDHQVLGLGVDLAIAQLGARARELCSVPGGSQDAVCQQAQGQALDILAEQLQPSGKRPSFLMV